MRRAATAEPSSGCVKRRRSPSSSRILAVERLGEAVVEAGPDGCLDEGTVGSASAATTRATSSAAGLRPSRRACRSASRSEGIGSSSPGASVPPLRWSALASSSAKKGLPCEVSQSLISVGRGNVASRRERSSWWVAPRLRPTTSIVRSRSSGTVRRSQAGMVAADRQQERDRHIVEARERVTECRERRRVQPLDVVDREAEGTVGREQPQRSEERGGHCAVVGVDGRLAEQQRGLERTPLDRRQLRQDVVGSGAEQVGEPCERKPGLGLRGARGQEAVAAGGGRVDAGQPEGRLADPRFALQHEHPCPVARARVEERVECAELLLPADDPARHALGSHRLTWDSGCQPARAAASSRGRRRETIWETPSPPIVTP